jgi:hypothetical protein
MTHPLLYSASDIVVLVTGRENAILLRELFINERNVARYPIHSLWPVMDKVAWLVNRDAAELLLSSNRIEMNCRKSALNNKTQKGAIKSDWNKNAFKTEKNSC